MQVWFARVCALVVLSVLLTPLAHADDGRWRRAESRHFIVYSDGSERRLREAVQQLESFDHALSALLTAQEPAITNKLEIYLVRDHSTLRRISPRMPEMVRGFYAAGADVVLAMAVFTDAGGLDAQEILFHEYAHHFMLRHFSNAYPAWYVEGFAEFVQTMTFDGNVATLGDYSRGRGAWALGPDWVSGEDFLDSVNARFTSDERAYFYAQSWAAVHYITTNTERVGRFQAYLAATQGGGDPIESFQPAFGVTPQDFQRDVRQYIRARIPRFALTLPTLTAAEIQVTRLSDAADNLLPLAARLRLGVAASGRAEVVNDVQRYAARFPDDRFAQLTSARALILDERWAQARTLLDTLVAADAQDVEAHYLLGLSYVYEAAKAEGDAANPILATARRHFANAFRVNSNHVPTLYRYATSYDLAAMPQSAVDVMVQAHLLAPQVDEISVMTAMALMQHGDFDNAVGVLRPVAYSPHRDNSQNFPLRLLEAAQDHRLLDETPPKTEEAAGEAPEPEPGAPPPATDQPSP
jgi:tetratricopeptide (TPR) repeat protein